MGLPIGKIICATNMNDIVHRTLSCGNMNMGENIEVSVSTCTYVFEGKFRKIFKSRLFLCLLLYFFSFILFLFVVIISFPFDLI